MDYLTYLDLMWHASTENINQNHTEYLEMDFAKHPLNMTDYCFSKRINDIG